MEGWIKLHRNLLNWRWATSSNHLAVFTTLLLRATHKESEWRNIKLAPGQLITGRKQLSSWTGLSEMQIRTILRDLVTSGEINQQITSKFSIISINNWSKYQEDNQQITSKQPASNQQVTTFKNAKNDNNEKNIIIKASPLSFLFHHRPDIQAWLDAGNHDTHLIIVAKQKSHHELAELLEKAFVWAQAKNQRAETWLLTFVDNKKTTGFGSNQAQKQFKRKGHGVEGTPENPTGDPYLQEAIDKGLVG